MSDPRQFENLCLAKGVELFLASRISRHQVPLLYHFTDLRGATGILHSRELWLSHVTTLNDATERNHGLGFVLKALHKIAKSSRVQFKKKLAGAAIDELENVESASPTSTDMDCFVVSFCETPNSLLHWLHYGRSGAGVALGFERPAFRSLCRDEYASGRRVLAKVTYDDGAKLARSRRIIDLIVGLCEKYKKKNSPSLFAPALSALTALLNIAAVSMKPSSFRDEREWRLIRYVRLKARNPIERIEPIGTGPDANVLFSLMPDSLVLQRNSTPNALPIRLAIRVDSVLVRKIVLGESCVIHASPLTQHLLSRIANGEEEERPSVERSQIPLKPA